MTRDQMKAMLGRGHRDVRIKSGPYASMAAKVIHPRPLHEGLYLIRLSNQREFLASPDDLGAAIPMGPDKFQEEQERRRQARREFAAPLFTGPSCFTEDDVLQAEQIGMPRRSEPKPAPDLLQEYNDPRQQQVREACIVEASWRYGRSLEAAKAILENVQAMLKGLDTKVSTRPPADAYTTVMGAVAWREQDRKNRRVHIAMIDDSTDTVEVWVTTLRPRLEREHRFTRHLPSAEVPAILDGLMMTSDLFA